MIGVPRILKETVEADKPGPFERVQEQTVDVPLPQILTEAVDVGDLAPANCRCDNV